LCVKFTEALASGKYWLAQAAARCPWHRAERRLVCIAVDSAVHLSQVGHFPPFDRSNCMQQTRERATTPRRDSNIPDTSPLEHRCQTRGQVASSTSPFVRDRPVDRPAPLWLRNLERCVPPPPRSAWLATRTLLRSSLRASWCLEPSCILLLLGFFPVALCRLAGLFFQLRSADCPSRLHRPSGPVPSPPTPLSGSFAFAFSGCLCTVSSVTAAHAAVCID